MPKVPRSVLKSFFETGDRPTQADFGSLIDSMLHYSEDQNRLGLRTYDPLGNYVVGDTTIFNGNIYQCTAAATGTFDPLKWNPMVQLGSVTYMGSWNANTNSPLIKDNVGSKGSYYVVSDAGTTSINGQNDWSPGDWIIFNGSKWEKVDNSSEPLNAIDVTFSPTGDITSLNVQAAIAELADDLVNGLANKANKVTGATLGNFAALNSSGNLTDSNFSPDDYLHKTNTNAYTPTDDYNPATKKYVDDLGATINSALADKLDVIDPPKPNHLVIMDGDGRLQDSGYQASDFLNNIHTALDIPFASPSGEIQAVNVQDAIIEVFNDISSGTTNKANKVVAAIPGNIVVLSPDGDIQDSGFRTSNFLSSNTTASNIPFAPGAGVNSNNVQAAIQEVHDQVTTASGNSIPVVPSALSGNIAVFDANGRLVDSLFQPGNFVQAPLAIRADEVRYNPSAFIQGNNVQLAIDQLTALTADVANTKINKVTDAIESSIALFSLDGGLKPSGTFTTNFMSSNANATDIPYIPGGGVNSTNVQTAIQELRTQIVSAGTSGMPLVPGAVAGNFAYFDTTGKVIDSGTKPLQFMLATTDASGLRFTPNGDISSNTIQNAIVELRDDTNVKLAAKMNQIESATPGNLAGFDSAGVLTDSGFKTSSFLPSTTTATNIPYTPGGGVNSTNVQTAIQELHTQIVSGGSSMPLVPTAVSGNLPVFDATGKVIDSGTKSSNFMPSNTDASGIRFTPNGDIVSITVQNAIVELRDDTNTKLALKLNKLGTVTAGNLAGFDSAGELTDSGFKSTNFLPSTTAAANIPFTPNGDIAASDLQSAVVEVRDDTNTKLASKYGTVGGAVTNNVVLFSTAGTLKDSGQSLSNYALLTDLNNLRRSVIPFVFPFNSSSPTSAASTGFIRIALQVCIPTPDIAFPGTTTINARLVVTYTNTTAVEGEAALSDFTNAAAGNPVALAGTIFSLPRTTIGVFTTATSPEFKLPSSNSTQTVIFRKVTAAAGSITIQSATLILRYS